MKWKSENGMESDSFLRGTHGKQNEFYLKMEWKIECKLKWKH